MKTVEIDSGIRNTSFGFCAPVKLTRYIGRKIYNAIYRDVYNIRPKKDIIMCDVRRL
jgi:hypothetical protein